MAQTLSQRGMSDPKASEQIDDPFAEISARLHKAAKIGHRFF
jgi:hypothetical protein